MIKIKRIIWSSILLVAIVALSPIVANPHLRFVNQNTLGHYFGQFSAPQVIYVGDSIMAGLRHDGNIGAINLSNNGLTSAAIADSFSRAQGYSPKNIVFTAGTNDAILGCVQSKGLRENFGRIVQDKRVLLVLALPTRSENLNARIESINEIAKGLAEESGVETLDLSSLYKGQEGLLIEEMTTDGVHLSQIGYEILRYQINEKLRSRSSPEERR